MSVRIIDLDTATSLQSGDYVVIDNSSGGTRKFNAANLGASVAGNIASLYSSSARYAIGQFCLYNNNLYRCISTISTPEAWNSAHWSQITVGDALYTKVDKITGKGLSANDFTDALKTKLDGIASGAEVNVQSDWNESDNTKDDYIKNKPGLATTSASGFMSASDKQKLDGIASGAEVNVQADWNQSNSSQDDYIKNKPTSDTTLTISGGFADAQTVGDALFDLYSSSATYDIGDCVRYQGALYVCTTEITTAEAWNSTHWTAMNVGDVFEAIVSGEEQYAFYHLGFYIDENGDINQVDDDE